jgi:hypothetical protein
MNWTSYPEPKRKTDQYPGGNLPDDGFYDFLMSSDHPIRSDGKSALAESFRAALGGIQYTNHISCLRGQLRKAVIKLAEDIHKSDNIKIPPTERKRMREAATSRFVRLIYHNKVVSEVKYGQTIWRLKQNHQPEKLQTTTTKPLALGQAMIGPSPMSQWEFRQRHGLGNADGKRKYREYLKILKANSVC